MDNTILLQGKFTSTGSAVTIPLRSGVDWMKTMNYTVSSAPQTTAIGQSFYWQAGMDQGTGFEHLKAGSGVAGANLDVITTTGFTLIDSSVDQQGNPNATVSAVSNASIPVVSATASNLTAGQMVRLSTVAGAPQLGGIDFTVGYNTLTSGTFSLDYMSQLSVAGTTGSWTLIKYDPLFYPRRRCITKITQASQAVVTLSVTHGYKVGQLVRVVVPAVFGMTQMNNLQATIVAINTTTTSGNTITLNIDSSAFTAFAFPTAASLGGGAFTPAQIVPVGQDTPYSLSQQVDILSDRTTNTGFIGMQLAAGANGPAGQDNDVIYWVAGKSFSVDNQ